MLDSITLRVAFGVTTLTLFLLFALVTFRATRSPFSFWWCTALVLFMGGIPRLPAGRHRLPGLGQPARQRADRRGRRLRVDGEQVAA
ncbi:hypothetical protein CmmCFBP4999_11135 [Clavibacter michiganensis subsp. michiganensis]|nr:hypothetical protein [Clavibacter michiganensis subsp. michiganensis]MWJ89056.1 hypothetical protein [Clavibacter michiganensis subsp. michiganensis]OQJ66396.1 hypothetical protein B5P23_10760 [Clavibacter michiganensis subsp. michiganensis]QGV75465.1 hypothetical protein EFE39_09570 [Clavibacter michiganensis subsp. michiganensis]RMC86970.1 hypothetical protein CmmCFBP4999_11135 [Clavibacter michiganensis subsp. michiganensis]